MRKIWCLFLLIIISMSGCSTIKEKADKIKDIDFILVDDREIPEELAKLIEEKKHSEFKVTYADGACIYIVVGYGEQATGGYSIAVNDLYLSSNAIYLDTNLIGPTKDEKTSQVITYPYIVIKMEYLEENVVFQ